MKKSILALMLVASSFTTMTACVPITGVPIGIIVTDVSLNEHVTQNKIGSKTGEACAHSVLGLVAWGDGSAANAAKQAGITSIATVDGNLFSVLGIYISNCTTVTGE